MVNDGWWWLMMARGSHLPLNHVGSHLPLNEVRWSGFRGECDPRSGANVTPAFAWAGAIVSEPQKDFFHPIASHIDMLCDVPTAISINFQDTMDAMVYHCYVVTSISSNFEDALDVTFQEPFQSTSRTLWMLGCKIHFEHLRRRFGCP